MILHSLSLEIDNIHVFFLMVTQVRYILYEQFLAGFGSLENGEQQEAFLKIWRHRLKQLPKPIKKEGVYRLKVVFKSKGLYL